jgi:hypothetical protein
LAGRSGLARATHHRRLSLDESPAALAKHIDDIKVVVDMTASA